MRRSVSRLVAVVTQLIVVFAFAGPTDGLKW
jgi:hypothetical protein